MPETRPGHLQFWERDPEVFGAPDQCVEFGGSQLLPARDSTL